MNEQLAAYINFLRLEKNASMNTVESYSRDLKRYLHFLDDRRVRRISGFFTTSASPRGAFRGISRQSRCFTGISWVKKSR